MADSMVARILRVLAGVEADVICPASADMIAVKGILALTPTLDDLEGAKRALTGLAAAALQIGAEEAGQSEVDRMRWLDEALEIEANRDTRLAVLVSVHKLLSRMAPDSH